MRRRLAGAAVAMMIAIAGCGSDDETESTGATGTTDAPSTTARAPATSVAPATTAAPTTASAPGTTVAPTTAPATTNPSTTESTPTTEATPTTTGEPVSEGFDPPCVEAPSALAASPPPSPEGLDALGPLGAEPTLTIDLPASRNPADPAVDSPVAAVDLIAGGVVVSVRGDYGAFEGSLLTAVDFDGTVRWVKCLPETITSFYAAPGSDHGFFGTSTSTSPTWSWWRIDLLSGASLPEPASLPAELRSAVPVAGSGDTLLFGPPEETVIDPRAFSLGLFDLEQGTEESIPFPDAAAGQQMFQLHFEFADDGELVMVSPIGMVSGVIAAFHDGEWTTDPVVLGEAYGIRADLVFGDSAPAISGFDARGQVVWTRDDVTPFGGEGFVIGSSGGVTVVAGCFEALDEGMYCDKHEVGGLDTATGGTLWQLPGDRGVGPVGDGHALVTDGTDSFGWIMIDTDTGEQVDESQQWDNSIGFGSECCGEGDYTWTGNEGGLVVATRHRRISIWLPRGADIEPSVIALP